MSRTTTVIIGGGQAGLAMSRQLTDRGFIHYEVSNFARPDCECRHNWQYWNGGAYLGLGPSAHSYLPPFRMWNVFQWDAYRRAVCSGQAAGAGVERVDGEDLELERTWLSLRTRAGLSAGDPAWAGDGESLLERWIEAVASSGARERLIVFGSVHPRDGDAERKLRALHSLGIRGIKLHPTMQRARGDSENLSFEVNVQVRRSRAGTEP